MTWRTLLQRLTAVVFPLTRIRGGLNDIAFNDKGGQSFSGWLAAGRTSTRAAMVDIVINKQLAASTRPGNAAHRAGGLDDRRLGFSAECPPSFASGETLNLVMKARVGVRVRDVDRRIVRRAPFGTKLAESKGPLHLDASEPTVPGDPVSFAAIIPTQDGAALLRDLLDSIAAFEQSTFRRIVVVDHASADDTPAVVRAFAAHLPMELLTLPRATSYSQANNRGAACCDEDVLVFLNNDIVLTAPVVRNLSAHLTTRVGLVGLKLMDAPVRHDNLLLEAQQHVGVHFSASPDGLRPFESRVITDSPGANHTAIETPAVTAAFMAVRRSSFAALGGFDERYFFGWEDVDLCMRSLSAGLANVSVNDISATHLGAHTRRRMPQALKERRAFNAALFEERWGQFVRRAFARDLFERPGFWSGRKLNLGVALPQACSERTEMVATSIGQALAEELPAKIFLFSATDPADAQDLDVLISLDPELDVGKLPHASATIWLIACVLNSEGSWAENLWRESYDVWFASTASSADTLSELLGRQALAMAREPGAADAARIADILRRRSAGGLRVALHRAPLPGRSEPDLPQLRRALEALGHTVRLALGPDALAGTARDDAIIRLDDIAGAPEASQALEVHWQSSAHRGAAESAAALDAILRSLEAERMSADSIWRGTGLSPADK